MAKPPRDRREHRIRFAWTSTSAGDSVSHARASTKKRTIALAAATSSPLPLTSPISTATAPLGSVHTPKTSPPPTSCATGS